MGRRSIGGLMPPTVLTDEVTGAVTTPVELTNDAKSIVVEAKFVYGSGGTSAKFWIQTSVDGGDTWIDIANFAFATTTATKVSALTTSIALAAAVVPTDGTMTDDAILNGLLGDRFRVKYTTTGVYADDTTIEIDAQAVTQ